MSRLMLAADLQTNKSNNRRLKKGDVGKLLDNTLTSWYWLGFLLADGSFTYNSTRLKLQLAKQDEDQVRKFCNYLDKDFKSAYSASFMDKRIVPKIFDKLFLTKNKPKTYNPPNQRFEATDETLAMLVGFIDGDGCIQLSNKRLTTQITIKIHKSWLNFLDNMKEVLELKFGINIESKAIFTKDNKYVYLIISNFEVQKKLKIFVLNNSLPVLKRKWDKIDINYIGQYELSYVNKQKYRLLHKYGVSDTDACTILGLNRGTIHKYKKEILTDMEDK